MKLKKVCSVILAAALTFSLSVTPVLADEVSDLKKQKQETQSQVSSLQTQLSSLMTKISDLEEDLIQTGEEISQTEEDLKKAEEEQEAQYEAMKVRIKYMYEEGSGSAVVEKVLTSGNITEVLNQAEYSQQVHSYDREKLDEYVATVEKVKDLKTSLEEKQADLQDTQKEYESQKTELNTTITQKSNEIDDLDDQIKAAVKKAAEEEAKRKAEEAAKKKAAAEAAAKKSSSSSKKSSGSSNSSNSNSSNSNSSNSSNNSSDNSNSSKNESNYDDSSSDDSNNSSNDSSDNGSDNNSSNNGASYDAGSGSTIVSAAYSQIGVPYVWGGSTPGVGLDCSGLVQYCYAQAGISIPRTSGDILASGTIVSDPQPGDICWTPGHVAIYIGGGQMIEAPTEGQNVKVSSVRVTYYVRY